MLLKQLFSASKTARLYKPLTFSCSQRVALFSTDGETETPQYENILVDTSEEGVALITLNRPKALNALCYAMFKDLHQAMT